MMKRRELLALVGGATLSPAVAPLLAHAQSSTPVIGFLHSASLEPNAKRLEGFRRGLRKAGFVEGENVAIDYRWAGGQNALLPQLATELARKPVNVIATLSSTPATIAAKAATASVPIVFLIAEDPVQLGLATSLNRPGGNATGISSQNAGWRSGSGCCANWLREPASLPCCSIRTVRARRRCRAPYGRPRSRSA